MSNLDASHTWDELAEAELTHDIEHANACWQADCEEDCGADVHVVLAGSLDTSKLELCDCCMILLANGDACDCPNDDGREHPSGLMLDLSGADVTLGMFWNEHRAGCEHAASRGRDGGECDCEREDFSTAPCDGCGTYLAGSRNAATLWRREGEQS